MVNTSFQSLATPWGVLWQLYAVSILLPDRALLICQPFMYGRLPLLELEPKPFWMPGNTSRELVGSDMQGFLFPKMGFH
jgi:hypothetical protein